MLMSCGPTSKYWTEQWDTSYPIAPDWTMFIMGIRRSNAGIQAFEFSISNLKISVYILGETILVVLCALSVFRLKYTDFKTILVVYMFNVRPYWPDLEQLL